MAMCAATAIRASARSSSQRRRTVTPQGNGAVQRSGVEEQRAKAVRQQAGDCRFSRGGGTVDGDHC